MQTFREYKTWICKFFMIGLTVILPLYAVGGWWKLGDTKYSLFRNMTLFCLGTWLIMSAMEYISGTWVRHKFSSLDITMLLYGGVVVISACCSPYPDTAWFGYQDWHMGAITQLLFVGIYFMIANSRFKNDIIVRIWQISFLAVVLLGVLHRLGLDPLLLMKGVEPLDWEYSHMISTIGNINWLCGYCSVAMVPVVTGYLYEKKNVNELLLLAACSLTLLLLLIQGSDMGILLVVLCLLLSMLRGIKDMMILFKTLILAGATCILLRLYGRIVMALGESAWLSLPADGLPIAFYTWNGWLLVGSFLLIICALFRVYAGKFCQNKKGAYIGGAAFAFVSILVLGGFGILFFRTIASGVSVSDLISQLLARGNERVPLWRLSLESFLEGDWRQKLVGAGPDCFAEYVYSEFTGSVIPDTAGHWANAVFANAHNEWLNHLVNLGIMGTMSYFAIFVSAGFRYRKDPNAVMALVLYFSVSLVGFQQCLSTPFLFLILGMCENKRRQRKDVKEYEMGEVQN